MGATTVLGLSVGPPTTMVGATTVLGPSAGLSANLSAGTSLLTGTTRTQNTVSVWVSEIDDVERYCG